MSLYELEWKCKLWRSVAVRSFWVWFIDSCPCVVVTL